MASDRSLPIKFVPTFESSDPNFCSDFPNYVLGTIRSEPGNYITSPPYAKAAESVYHMKLRPDDVFVVSFPKCGEYIIICFNFNIQPKLCDIIKSGSTWVLDLVWMVVNDCDFEKGKASLQSRGPLIEYFSLCKNAIENDKE